MMVIYQELKNINSQVSLILNRKLDVNESFDLKVIFYYCYYVKIAIIRTI